MCAFLGKTRQAIALIAKANLEYLGSKAPAIGQRTLIVVPPNLLSMWKQTLEKELVCVQGPNQKQWGPVIPTESISYAPGSSIVPYSVEYHGTNRFKIISSIKRPEIIRIVLTTPQTIYEDLTKQYNESFLSKESSEYKRWLKEHDLLFDRIIVDEAHRLTSNGEHAKILMELIKSTNIPHRWALTATPYENTGKELAWLAHFIGADRGEYAWWNGFNDTEIVDYAPHCLVCNKVIDKTNPEETEHWANRFEGTKPYYCVPCGNQMYHNKPLKEIPVDDITNKEFHTRLAIDLELRTKAKAKLDKIRQWVSTFVLQRHKTDIGMELPEIQSFPISVQFETDDEQRNYDRYLETRIGGTVKQIKTGLDNLARSKRTNSKKEYKEGKERFHQSNPYVYYCLCCLKKNFVFNFVFCFRKKKFLEILSNLSIASTTKSKYKMVTNIIENDIMKRQKTTDFKLVIFGKYINQLEALKNHIASEWFLDDAEMIDNEEMDIYHGDLTFQERDEILKRFRNPEGTRVLLMSLKCGYGLDLSVAHDVIFLQPHYNPLVIEQAKCRLYRFGQKNPVRMYMLYTENTIEQYMMEIAKRKSEIAELYLGKGFMPKFIQHWRWTGDKDFPTLFDIKYLFKKGGFFKNYTDVDTKKVKKEIKQERQQRRQKRKRRSSATTSSNKKPKITELTDEEKQQRIENMQHKTLPLEVIGDRGEVLKILSFGTATTEDERHRFYMTRTVKIPINFQSERYFASPLTLANGVGEKNCRYINTILDNGNKKPKYRVEIIPDDDKEERKIIENAHSATVMKEIFKHYNGKQSTAGWSINQWFGLTEGVAPDVYLYIQHLLKDVEQKL